MAEYLIKNGRVIDCLRNIDKVCDIGVAKGVIVEPEKLKNPKVIDAKGKVVCKGFIDLHVHLRQPGNTGAETIATGTRAAAAGGFTSIISMPNSNPAADNVGTIEFIRQTAARSGAVKVLPCGCMTKNYEGGEMAGIGALKQAGVAALSDDGRCVQNHALMRHIIQYAASFKLPILDHCEEESLKSDGVMHEGKWSVLLGMKGIPSESEEIMVARDVMFLRGIPEARIHIQHVSAAGSAELIRRARKEGLKITGEVTPHHIALTDETAKKFDTNYKMNPPLRSEADRQSLIAALKDGSITVIATDHAPHTGTLKEVEFDDAPFGIIGLETAFAVCMTELYHAGHLSLQQLIAKLTTGPAEVLGIENYSLAPGQAADLVIFDPKCKYTVDKNKFFSKSRNTPFDGYKAKGKIELTMVDGKVIYTDGVCS